MKNKWRICYVSFGLLLLFSLVSACKTEQKIRSFYELSGQTMGTTYECKFDLHQTAGFIQKGVDSILLIVNAAASTYIPSSFVSQFNSAADGYCAPMHSPEAIHMKELMRISKRWHGNTGGYFNPSIMPLVNYWGFGYTDKKMRTKSSPEAIDSLLSYCDFSLINEQKTSSAGEGGQWYCLRKSQAQAQLDFSAVAKGYAVDLISDYLMSRGSLNYYINIGGEALVEGFNSKGNPWTLGINYPDTSASLTELFAVVQTKQDAMASSGNYRNFYTTDGGYHAHTINPKTGLARPSDLLGVTILAEECADADALATACMVMGYKKARVMIESLSSTDAFFIYRNVQNNKLEYYGTPDFIEKIKIK